MTRLLLILISLLGLGISVGHRVRVIGGKSAQPGQFPYSTALENDNWQYCDGSIIDKSWIVTAAHCLFGISPEKVQVLAGTNLLHTGGTIYNVSFLIPHENFSFINAKNDIGLIKIDGTIKFTDLLKPIEIGVAGINDTVIVTGWGTTGDEEYPEDLQFVELRALSLEECQQRAHDFMQGQYLGPEQVCALGQDGQGACFGDSGGPLVSADGTKLVGIVSFGFEPCAKGVPDVYTRVATYQNWINEKILKN